MHIFDFDMEKRGNIGYNKIRTKRRERMIMSVLHINKDNFDLIKNSEKKVLLDFYADWCGPCSMVSPIVEEIAAERDDILVAKINIDNEPELSAEFSVVSIPSFFVLEKGRIVNQATGARPKPQILALLD